MERTPEERIEESIQFERLGKDLTALAKDGTLEPIYHREELISNVSQLLSSENNVLLVGKPGVGKNALVASLAYRLINPEEQISASLKERKILECTVISFEDEAYYIHEFETKTSLIVQHCKKTKTMLFLDNTHMAIVAGAASGKDQRTLANLLIPYLDGKELLMIGATTPEGYDFMAKANPSFVERFTKVEMEETSPEETVDILRKIKPNFEKKHDVKIKDDVLTFPVKLVKRFLPWHCLPGKAISLMKEAIALCSEQRIRLLDKSVFLKVMHKKTGLPQEVLSDNVSLPFNKVFQYFENAVYGQKQAIQPLVDTILMLKTQLNEPSAPLGVFLFIGPTGVGKTLLARRLAAYLFGSEDRLVRFDMSEFAEYSSISKLIGNSGGSKRALLVDKVLAHPCSVILFDEIEKAHPNIFDLLLGIMGEGRLTDSVGRTAMFTNCIIILTSNIGSELYQQSSRLTLIPQEESNTEVTEEQIHTEIKDFFRPEFINRLTHIVQFKPLSEEIIKKIAQKEIYNLLSRLTKSKPSLEVQIDSEVLSRCIEEGYKPEYGARPMKRAVMKLLTYPLGRLLSKHPDLTRGQIKIHLNDTGDIEAVIKEHIVEINDRLFKKQVFGRMVLLRKGSSILNRVWTIKDVSHC